MSSGATIDFAAIEAEVSKLSDAEARERLFKFTVRAKKAQKASYNPERAKIQRQKAAAEFAALKARAKELGILEQVQAEAKAKAEADILAKEQDEAEEAAVAE